jgi:hypothetical protein
MVEKIPTTLSAKDKKKFKKIRPDMGNERAAEALPLIDERTINGLKSILDIKGNPEAILSEEKQNQAQWEPYFRGYKIAEGYLQEFSQDEDISGTKSLTYQVHRWLQSAFPRGNYDYYDNPQDAATIGLFLVFKAFDLQLGHKFKDNLKKIKAKEVMQVFDELRPLAANNASIVERSINKIKIPEDQYPLEDFIDKYVYYYSEHLGPEVRSGAVFGFKVIEKLWPKLKSEENKRT